MKGSTGVSAAVVAIGMAFSSACCRPVSVTQGETQCEVRPVPGSPGRLVVECRVAVVTHGATTDTTPVVASDTIPDPNP